MMCSLKSYDKFKVYSIQYRSMKDVETMKYWQHNPYVEFWNSPGVNKTGNVLVHPSMQINFEKFLSFENFNYEILIENVEKLVELPLDFLSHPLFRNISISYPSIFFFSLFPFDLDP